MQPTIDFSAFWYSYMVQSVDPRLSCEHIITTLQAVSDYIADDHKREGLCFFKKHFIKLLNCDPYVDNLVSFWDLLKAFEEFCHKNDIKLIYFTSPVRGSYTFRNYGL